METRALGSIEHRRDCPRDAGRRGEARQPTLRKGMQGLTAGLDAPADVLGNLGGGLVLRTGS
jgi:hypothetical protein